MNLQSEYQHFEWVPQEAWNMLISWFGGGPAFPREVRTFGGSKDLRVDMYPQVCSVSELMKELWI